MFSGTASSELFPIYVVYKSQRTGGLRGAQCRRLKSGLFDAVCFDEWFRTASPGPKKRKASCNWRQLVQPLLIRCTTVM